MGAVDDQGEGVDGVDEADEGDEGAGIKWVTGVTDVIGLADVIGVTDGRNKLANSVIVHAL